jgi:hypothetical protein
MKMLKIFVIAIAAACLFVCLPGVSATGDLAGNDVTSSTGNHPITVDQAKNSVRHFMDDMSIDPVFNPDVSDVSTGNIWNLYYLSAGNASFRVNENTGIVEFAHFDDNGGLTPDPAISRDTAFENAREYAGKKYDGFSGKTWKLVIDKVYEYSYPKYNVTAQKNEWTVVTRDYVFVFREVKDGVLLPNIVQVRINPTTGAVEDYWGVDRIVTTGLKNTISLDEATTIAKDRIVAERPNADVVINSSDGYLAVVTCNRNGQNLAWVVEITYHAWGRDYERKNTVFVSADDGSILTAKPMGGEIWPESRISSL